jgi:histone acetyltransferase (RNA polymerase elongator complex component)
MKKIRRQLLGRIVSDKEIIKACHVLVDNGIRTYTNIMIGLPRQHLKNERSRWN